MTDCYHLFKTGFSITGDCDPVRRWQRMLDRYCPEILQDPKTLRQGRISSDR
jgi:hypothetical protein